MACNKDWFRFYTRMIDSPQVLQLNDSEFRLLVSIWCLAKEEDCGGHIPHTVAMLRRRVMPDHSEEEIEKMIAHLCRIDLLEEDEDARGCTVPRWEIHQYEYTSRIPSNRSDLRKDNGKTTESDCEETGKEMESLAYTRSEPEPELETDKDKDKEKILSPDSDAAPSIPPTPHQEIITAYNQACSSLPKVLDATNGRKDKIRVLWKQHPDINQFLEVFHNAEVSEFLSGRDGKWTGCNFDWLIKGANFQKVLEGTYKQREPTKKIPRAYQSLMDYAKGGES